MTKLKLLSAALFAAAMLATPAMARESHITSRHRAEDADASATPGARYIGEGDDFPGNHVGGPFGGPPGDYGGYGYPARGVGWRSSGGGSAPGCGPMGGYYGRIVSPGS